MIGRTMFAPTICVANAVKATKTVCTSDIQKACTASTGKGNYRRLQAQADSEGRAIPPDGFTAFSLGQCCQSSVLSPLPKGNPTVGANIVRPKASSLEEVPDRAEEYLVPLEKGDARQGRGIL